MLLIPDFLITQVREGAVEVVLYQNGQRRRAIVRNPLPPDGRERPGMDASGVLVLSPSGTRFSLGEAGLAKGDEPKYRLKSYDLRGRQIGEPVEAAINFTEFAYAGWIDDKTPAIVTSRINDHFPPSQPWVIHTSAKTWSVPTTRLPKPCRLLRVSLLARDPFEKPSEKAPDGVRSVLSGAQIKA